MNLTVISLLSMGLVTVGCGPGPTRSLTVATPPAVDSSQWGATPYGEGWSPTPAALSPSGRLLAVCFEGSLVWMDLAALFKPGKADDAVGTLQDVPVDRLVFSDDGRWLAASEHFGSDPAKILVFDCGYDSVVLRTTIQGPEDFACIQFDRQSRLAYSSWDKVQVVDPWTGEVQWSKEGEPKIAEHDPSPFVPRALLVPHSQGTLVWLTRGAPKAVRWELWDIEAEAPSRSPLTRYAPDANVWRRDGEYWVLQQGRAVGLSSGKVVTGLPLEGRASPDGLWLGKRTDNKRALDLYSLITGKVVWRVAPVGDTVGENWVYLGTHAVAMFGGRGFVYIADLNTGKIAVTLAPFLGATRSALRIKPKWLAFTPDEVWYGNVDPAAAGFQRLGPKDPVAVSRALQSALGRPSR